MKAETKYFGQIDYEPEQALSFPKGLFGFEDEKSFLLLPFEGNGTLFSLQSLTTPQLAFVAMDPFSLDNSYAPVLQPEELEAMKADRSEELYYYALCAVKTPVADSTVNLRCPIVINEDTRQAMQVILEQGGYHMRHRLSDFEQKEEAAPC